MDQKAWDYISNCSMEAADTFLRLLGQIHRLRHDAVYGRSYGLVELAEGKKRIHVGYAKHHVGLYMGKKVTQEFKERLEAAGFEVENSTIRFRFGQTIDDELLSEMLNRVFDD